jgi:hypothetical protein
MLKDRNYPVRLAGWRANPPSAGRRSPRPQALGIVQRSSLSVIAAVGLAAMALVSPAAAVAESSHPHAATSQVVLTGQIRDGRVLEHSRAAKVVVPYGLPAVAGAVVSLPQLGLRTVSDRAGNFSFRFPSPLAMHRTTYTLVVRKPGFGVWQESDIVLTPGNAEGLYVQLMSTAQRLHVTKPVRQPYNGRPIRLRGHAGVKPEVAGGCSSSTHSSTWYSQSEMPLDIRVYFPSTNQVLTYNFSWYQQHTLPNEWIATWKEAALQAGAVAVRDYAWYFIVDGSKGTPDGYNPCAFDVDNTTDYQNFVPTNPTYASTNEAVNTTAAYLFTTGGDIPETSFNSGADTDGCGTGNDTSGTAMSQWGSQACAQDGDDFQTILGVYYHPGYSLANYASRGPGAAVDPSNDHQYVFWAGQDGDLWEAYYNGSSWSDQDLGIGPLGSEPAVAVSPDQSSGGNSWQYVFWKGTDGNLWEAWWDGSWNGPENLGMGPLGSEPTVGVDANGNQFVFWEGTQGNLWEALYNGTWNGPSDLGDGPLGSSPTVAVSPIYSSGGYGYQFVFWRGTDGNLWEAYWTGSWHGRQSLGDGPLGSPPSAATDSIGNEYVFWAGQNAQLWEAHYSGSSWSGGSNGMGPLGSAPSVGVDAGSAQFVYWKGTDANLWQAYYDGSWNGPYSLGDGQLG